LPDIPGEPGFILTQSKSRASRRETARSSSAACGLHDTVNFSKGMQSSVRDGVSLMQDKP
jgi:hypothetical protein